MRRIPAIVLLIVVSACAVSAQNAQDEQKIRDIISGSDRAKLSADVGFFDRTYAAEYTYAGATGTADDKRTSLGWYEKNLKGNSSFKLSSMKSNVGLVRVIGDMAVVTGTWSATVEGTEKNPFPPYVNHGRFTTVLEKRDGRWVIIAEHDSEAPRDRKELEQQVLEAGRGYNELMMRLKSGRAYAELVKQGDIAALDRLLADEYMYTSRDGEVSNKAEDLESYKANTIKIETAEILEQKVRVIGNTTAVETGAIRYRGSNKGVPFDITKRYTTTWVWGDFRWQVVADHTSKVGQ